VYICSRILWNTTNFAAQILSRTATSNEIFYEQDLYTIGAAPQRRRPFHKYIGAVAGLAENMAGLRFLCAHTSGAFPTDIDIAVEPEKSVLLTYY